MLCFLSSLFNAVNIHFHPRYLMFLLTQMDVYMSNKFFTLNNTTQSLGKIFPALLICTPAVAFSATIEQSTSVPQTFSDDAEYVINKDVTITSAGSEAAVTVSGFTVTKATNQGNISGTGNGLDINTGAQHVEVNNEEGATITSTTGTAVNIESMQGKLTTVAK